MPASLSARFYSSTDDVPGSVWPTNQVAASSVQGDWLCVSESVCVCVASSLLALR